MGMGFVINKWKTLQCYVKFKSQTKHHATVKQQAMMYRTAQDDITMGHESYLYDTYAPQ